MMNKKDQNPLTTSPKQILNLGQTTQAGQPLVCCVLLLFLVATLGCATIPDADAENAESNPQSSPNWSEVIPGDTESDYWRLVTPDAQERGAVCNNGGAYAYWVRPGRDDDAQRWVIHLQGGGSCGYVEECQARWDTQRHRMIPDGPNARPSSNGVLNPDSSRNPDWGSWTHVFLPYCSSDTWAGDNEASDETGGWHFRGSRIVRTVLSDLTQPPSGIPSLSDATDVMLSGSSAGSVGVKHNLDTLSDTLPWASVIGVIDSAFGPPSEPVDPDDTESRNVWLRTMRWELWNPQPDASCLESEESPLTCLDGSYVLFNHTATPFFAYMDQFDANSFSRRGISGLCVQDECVTDNQCGTQQRCVEGICAGPVCGDEGFCATGTCHEAGACYADGCELDDECPGEEVCHQGFCLEGDYCHEDADCGAEGLCVSGRCQTQRTCTTNSACDDGDVCHPKVHRCVAELGCSSNDDCDADRHCLNPRHTPDGQTFARDVRETLALVPAAFSTRAGIHTLITKPNFFDLRVDGVSYADVLANWAFGRPGPTHVVATW